MKCLKYSQQDYIRLLFIYSSCIFAFLIPQQFSDSFRFLLYLMSSVFAFAIIIYSIINKKNDSIANNAYPIKNVSSYALVLFGIVSVIINIVHKEFLVHGLAACTELLLLYVSFMPRDSAHLEKEIQSIPLYYSFISLFGSVVSLLIIPIYKIYPQITEIYINNNISTLSRMVITAISEPSRLTGYGLHANVTGLLCGMGVICSIIIILKNKDNKLWKYIISAINIITCCVVLLISSSRTSILAACGFTFLLLIVYFAQRGEKEKRVKQILLIALLLAICCLIILFIVMIASSEARTVIFNKIIRVDSIKTATGRTILQEKVLKAAKISPFIGISQEDVADLTTVGNSHNVFIEILAVTGVPNLIIFSLGILFIIVSAVKIGIKSKYLNSESALNYAICTGLFVAILIDNSFEMTLLYSFNAVFAIEIWVLGLIPMIWNNLELSINNSKSSV